MKVTLYEEKVKLQSKQLRKNEKNVKFAPRNFSKVKKFSGISRIQTWEVWSIAAKFLPILCLVFRPRAFLQCFPLNSSCSKAEHCIKVLGRSKIRDQSLGENPMRNLRNPIIVRTLLTLLYLSRKNTWKSLISYRHQHFVDLSIFIMRSSSITCR